MIKIKHVYKKYKGITVIKNMSYKFDKGLYLITGASGKGKTTLLNILGGVDKKYDGNVEVNESVLYFKDKGSLPSNLTVKEVFYLFEQINGKKINDYVNVNGLINKKVKKLSLGETQLVILNLVLNSDDNIIILDEPFSALSEDNLKKVCFLLEKKAKNILVIIATHNINFFKSFTILDLNKHKSKSIKENVISARKKSDKTISAGCYLLYLKKTIIRKIMFLVTICVTIFNYFYINEYANFVTNDVLLDVEENKGVIIEKSNEFKLMEENIFYEIVKKIAKYVSDYNANYYNSKLYEDNIMIDNYYIDNSFSLSSIHYTEEQLLENEVIVGFDYASFCKANNIGNCDENHLKILLVNKKMSNYKYIIKSIFNNKETVILNNKRFNKIYEEGNYEEYYFDIKKEDEGNVFNIINKDAFLTNFEFIKIGENEDSIRYVVKCSESSNFIYENIDYSKFVVCLDKGYNCMSYLNHFDSLVSINDFKDISKLDFDLIGENLTLEEIAVSSKLAEEINVKTNETIKFYFNYEGKIIGVPLVVKNVVDNDKYLIYHNSDWSYYFFKEKIGFESKDLLIKNIVIYEDVKDGFVVSENAYKEALEEIKKIIEETNKIIKYVNVGVSLISVMIVILIECFYNKFKKEYFSYIGIVSGKKA